MEEGWLGKAQHKVEGVIFTYDPDDDTKVRIKDVSEKDILARVEGKWTEKVVYSLGSKLAVRIPSLLSLHRSISNTSIGP